MIIVDTTVRIDHFRTPNTTSIAFLPEGRARMHPFVLGESALGNWPSRAATLKLSGRVQSVDVAKRNEVLLLASAENLFGQGVGFVDVLLPASARLMPGTRVWTHDRRFAAAADRISLPFRALH